MKIDSLVLLAVRSHKECKKELMNQLKKGRTMLSFYMNKNLPDGPLTTTECVEIISRHLGIDKDKVLV